MGIWSYSGTASANTSISGISWAEGMAPSNVNNGVRQLAADIRNFADDTGGKLTAGGTADALTLNSAGDPPALADGLQLAFVAAASNTGAATLTVDALAAKAIRKVTASSTNDVALAANDLRANGHYTVRYDASANSAAGAWILLNPSSNSVRAAFRAHRNGTDTGTLTSATNVKIAFTTEAFDEGNYFSVGSNLWTPPAGLVFIHGAAVFNPTNIVDQQAVYCFIYKNGAVLASGFTRASGATLSQGAEAQMIDQANGTDYYEMYARADGAGDKTVNGVASNTYFEGWAL